MSDNRYEVLGKIAEGGLGAVYKAYDRNLRREVALKRVRADSQAEADRQAEQLFAEARTLSLLQHPHIVTIYDVGQDTEGAYIVMELLKGETLEDIIERGALNKNDFNELVTQSLEGIIAAHATGLIHLDIKPQNFMVIWLRSGKFQIKILDFGLSKISHQPMVQETDEEGAVLGSIFFMAPEQFERSPVDIRTDLYSLACVYYFALSQNYPFQGDTAPEVMASHLYHSLIPLSQLRPDLPTFVHQWVEWLMSRDPNNRPENAQHAYEVFRSGKFPTRQVQAPAPDFAIPIPDFQQPTTPAPGPTTSQILRPTVQRPTRKPGTTTQLIGKRPAPRPVAKPVNIAAAMAPKHLKPVGALPKWLTTGLPLALIVLVVGYLAVSYFLRSQREARFQELSQMEKPAGNEKDVRMLLSFLDDPAKSEQAGKLLGKLEGADDANRLLIADIQRTKNPLATKNLAMAIGSRHLEDGAAPLLAKLDTEKDAGARQGIWAGLSQIVSFRDMGDLLAKLNPEDAEELRVAETALAAAGRAEPNPDRRSGEVLRAYQSGANDDVKASLLRVLGKLGGSDALPALKDALKVSNVKVRTAAALALGDWPTAEPVLALEEFLRQEKDSYIRTAAINSLGTLAPLSGNVPQDEIAKELIAAYQATKDNRERIAILGALANVTSAGSVQFFTELPKSEPSRKSLANSYLKVIQGAMNKATTVAENAVLEAGRAQLTPGPLIANNGVIMNWLSPSHFVHWLVKLEQPGTYEVALAQSSSTAESGRYIVTFGDQRFPQQVQRTSSATDFKNITIGRVKFSQPGYYTLWIRPQQIPKGESLMRLKEAVVTRIGE